VVLLRLPLYIQYRGRCSCFHLASAALYGWMILLVDDSTNTSYTRCCNIRWQLTEKDALEAFFMEPSKPLKFQKIVHICVKTHKSRCPDFFYFFVNRSRSNGRSARRTGKIRRVTKPRNCMISIGHVGKLLRTSS
jgi:hypothetical protein